MGGTMQRRILPTLALVLALAGWGAGLMARAALAEPPTFEVRIKQHRFEPAVLQVPAGQMFKLVVHNDDPTPEEFESHSLKREKIIPGNSSATIYIAALKPGTYEFFGEFNEATAQGRIVAR